MKKRRRRRYNNHLWLYSIMACICLLTMGIGYALLSTENNFNIDVTKTTTPAGDTIKELLGSSTSVANGDGTLEKITHSGVSQTDSKVSYRYRGANPNNYVTFNGETAGWRIIGIVDGKVKLIRNESIGNYSWDNKDTSTGAESIYGKNDWRDARLMMLLNPKSDGTSYTGTGGSLYWNRGSGNCYAGSINATTSCNFKNIGLSNAAKTMIDKSTWYLGGYNSNYVKTNKMYEYERGTDVYSGRSTTWEGYVGLMYPSDYGYAALSNFSDSLDLHDYDNGGCQINNWLFKSIDEWTLMPLPRYSDYAYNVIYAGYLNKINVSSAPKVRPTIYLKSNVQIASGTGSSSDPYILKN